MKKLLISVVGGLALAIGANFDNHSENAISPVLALIPSLAAGVNFNKPIEKHFSPGFFCVEQVKQEKAIETLRLDGLLLDTYANNPVDARTVDFSELEDPSSLSTSRGREVYISNLKKVFVGEVRKRSGKEIADILDSSSVIYDADHFFASERQAQEFQKDALYYDKCPSLRIDMGNFSGSFQDFFRVYKSLKRDGRESFFFKDVTAFVPFSASAVGSREIYPVYGFPYWFDAFAFREARTTRERNALMLSDLGHEFAHILFNYDGFNFLGRKIEKNNFGEVLGLPESYHPGTMRLISELYATTYNARMLEKFPSLGKINSAFRMKVRNELSVLSESFPRLKEFLRERE